MHDESEWIRQIAQGDESAFERLFRCYAPRIFRFAMSYLNDPALAEEVVQETMIAVWKNAKDYKEQSQLSTWILGIARNKALDRARARQREPELLREIDRRASGRATPEQIARRDSQAPDREDQLAITASTVDRTHSSLSRTAQKNLRRAGGLRCRDCALASLWRLQSRAHLAR
jgi:RNA polymerase sigma-70 factor (ECF subfamily)